MLNQKLLELRKANTLTQSELAEKLHVSRQAISRWESGITIPDIEILKKLSILYNVSLDEIINSSITKATSTTEILSANHIYINAVLLIFATIATTVLAFVAIGVALFTLGYLFNHRKKSFCKLFIFITIIFYLLELEIHLSNSVTGTIPVQLLLNKLNSYLFFVYRAPFSIQASNTVAYVIIILVHFMCNVACVEESFTK